MKLACQVCRKVLVDAVTVKMGEVPVCGNCMSKRPDASSGKCCLCGHDYNRHGCNPNPLGDVETERCCHDCDELYVVPTRMGLAGFAFPSMDSAPTEVLRRFVKVLQSRIKN